MLAGSNRLNIVKVDSDNEREGDDGDKKTKKNEGRKSEEKERESDGDDRKIQSQIVDNNISNQISSPAPSQQTTNSAPSQPNNTNNCPPATPSNNPSQNQAKTTVNTPSSYRDGSYSSTINYSVPRSTETITVTINLSGGAISSVSTQNSAVRGDSKFYQTDFANSIAGQVSNKKIDTINLSAVGGASLTTDAFMQALQNIKKQAI